MVEVNSNYDELTEWKIGVGKYGSIYFWKDDDFNDKITYIRGGE